jgi:hypothetical protein
VYEQFVRTVAMSPGSLDPSSRTRLTASGRAHRKLYRRVGCPNAISLQIAEIADVDRLYAPHTLGICERPAMPLHARGDPHTIATGSATERRAPILRHLGILISAVSVLMLGLLTPLATADAVYHSQHIALLPAEGSPLRSGFVENIHANGPNVYAHEIYVVAGAAPATTYMVTLHLFSDTACTDEIATIPTATFETNGNGNGVGQAEFTPEQAGSLRGGTFGIEWTVTGGTAEYQTACSTVMLD